MEALKQENERLKQQIAVQEQTIATLQAHIASSTASQPSATALPNAKQSVPPAGRLDPLPKAPSASKTLSKKKGKKRGKKGVGNTASDPATTASPATSPQLPSKQGKSRKHKPVRVPPPSLDGPLVPYDMIAEKFPHMPLSDILRAQNMFREADANHDGMIDVTELDNFLMQHNLIFSVTQVSALLIEMDINGDDKIDFLEYLQLLKLLQDAQAFHETRQRMRTATSEAFVSIRDKLSHTHKHPSPSSSVCAIQ
eukprot:m.15522 g.15522  ORF g.15522 m.15522 type:complete len:254 (+) comp6642_c0_seq1:314-1075(+)